MDSSGKGTYRGGTVTKTEDVDAFMDRLDHPFKAEV